MLFLYTVMPGDDLTEIARKFGSTEEKIKEMNSYNFDDNAIGKRILIHSDQKFPEWLNSMTVFFDDIEPKQLEILLGYQNQDKMSNNENEITVEFDDDELQDISMISNQDDKNTTTVEDDDPILKYRSENANNIETDMAQTERLNNNTGFAEENGEYDMVHIVQKGECLADIAEKYGLTAGILHKLGAPEKLTEGMRVNIPPIQGRRYFYTVRLGDTLDKIAMRFGCSKDKIIKTNLLDENEQLMAGTVLIILI